MKSSLLVCVLAISAMGQTAAIKTVDVTPVAGESWLNHLHRNFDETNMGKTGQLGPPSLLESEDAGWIIGLPKIVEESALFASELNGMRSFYPLQGGRVVNQGMREMGVNAALVKERKERIINLDGRHACQTAIRGKDRVETNRVQRWIVVANAWGMNAVNTEPGR